MTKKQRLDAERLKEKLLRMELERRRLLRERLTDNALLPATHYLVRIAGEEEETLYGSGDLEKLYRDRDDHNAVSWPIRHAVRAI